MPVSQCQNAQANLFGCTNIHFYYLSRRSASTFMEFFLMCYSMAKSNHILHCNPKKKEKQKKKKH